MNILKCAGVLMRRRKTLTLEPGIFAKVMGHLDELNIKIIKEIKIIGPRNLSAIARNINAPKRTVHSRYVRLRKDKLLTVRAVPEYHLLGLINVVVLSTSPLRSMNKAKEVLAKHDYLHEIMECYGAINGLYAWFTIPIDRIKYFEKFIATISERGIIEDYRIYYTSNFKYYLPNFRYFSVRKRNWRFNLERFVSRIREEKIVEEEFEEPEYFRIQADYLDIAIIWALEVDATTRLAKIAKREGVSRSLIKYHYDEHVDETLVKEYMVDFPRFMPGTSNRLLFVYNFRRFDDLATFAGVLRETPYVVSMAKELRRNVLFAVLDVPVDDLGKLLKFTASDLSESFGIEKFMVMFLPPESYTWKPLPKDNFDPNRGWIYREYLPL